MAAHPSPTVRVACDDPLLLDEVIRYFEEIPHWHLLASAHSIEELNRATSPADFLILSDSLATKLAARPRGHPWGETIVFGRKESARTLRTALTLGAREFVVWPGDRLRLREIVEHERAVLGEHPPKLGALHAVWAPKGGSGSTVVAAHLAGAMAMLVAKCHLVDLDLEHSDQTAILGAEDESNSIVDLMRLGEELETAMVERIAWAHRDGFKAILGPDPRLRSSSADSADLMRVVTTVRETADHVIVDLPSGMSEVTTRTLREASSVLLVLTPDLLSLRRARDAFAGLRAAGLDPTRFVGLLNQAGGVDVTEKEVKSVLDLKTTFRVKADMQVYRAANRGELAVAGKRMLMPVARMLAEPVRIPAQPLMRSSTAADDDGRFQPGPTLPKQRAVPTANPRLGRSKSDHHRANSPAVVRVVGSKWRA